MTANRLLRLIVDTDPGGDDCFALLWVLSLVKAGVVDLVAVTTVEGNVSADRTFTNASQVLHLAGHGAIAVGRGRSRQEPGIDASHIHGSDGMGQLSATLPAATHDIQTAPASDDLLIEQLSANPGDITLIAVGPLTNLASAEAKCPGILRQAREVVIMGGAFQHRGNITPQAEFNLWFDPAAAETVLQSRDDLVMVPLDVTTQLRFTPAMAAMVAQCTPQAPLAIFLTQLCEFMVSTAIAYRETAGVPAFLVHDAAAVAYGVYPHLFQFRRALVQVETQGQWTRGQTLMSDRHTPQPTANAWIATNVDANLFFTYFLEDLKALL